MSTRPEAPGPLRRRGPRPLLLHLTLAMLRSTGSTDVSRIWNAASAILSAPQPGTDPPPAPFPQPSVAANPFAGDPALLAGIAAYRRHPYERRLPDPPAIWEEGSTRLLDYGPPEAPPVLFVPSLVNRAYVLDLAPGRSAMRLLAARGVRPLLLDWGWPDEVEKRFTLTDYVAGRLERAMAAIGRPVVLAGYCMGGLLAVAAAQRRPETVRALALLATPWDFHAGIEPGLREKLSSLRGMLQTSQLTGALPVDVLQTMFALLDPDGIATKYRGFGGLDQTSPRAEEFVALEDWLNDGIPLAAAVAEECFAGWYGANSPARGAWRIAGLPVDPTRLALPCFVAVPRRDRIVPPESATPLAELIPGATLLSPAAGHIGMAAGSRAESVLWTPLLEWLSRI